MLKKIAKIVRDVPPHWVGDGFPVRGMFNYQEAEAYDPFLLLDYASPYEFAPGTARRGVGAHPHRGFETVTIVFQGELEHGDSSGSRGKIGPGDVQWMTAASGVVHEEFHSDKFTRDGGLFEVMQLWVNLPAKDKLSAPKYQELFAANIPTVALPGGAGTARIIAGELANVRGPASTFTPINVWELRLTAGGETKLSVADGHVAILVLRDGEVRLNGDTKLGSAELARFDRAGDAVSIAAARDSNAVLFSGQPLGEPVVGQGPFVMNTREEIVQAIRDYQAGRMGRLVAEVDQ